MDRQATMPDQAEVRAPPATAPDAAPQLRFDPGTLAGRLGLSVPHEWWPSAPLLKSFEAAGFVLAQLPSPPVSVMTDPRQSARHAGAVREGIAGTGLDSVIHAPVSLLAGNRESDLAFEGLLAYAAEAGARQVVYHAHALVDEPSSQDRLLAETRSLARLAARAETLGVTIAIENLAPVFPGPERLSDTPMTLRGLANRIGSSHLGLCLDVGHAYIVADLKHTTLELLIEPVLDSVVLFHLHDNLGGRWDGASPAGLDPLRLDLHLPPGKGSLPWQRISPLLAAHRAPLVLEVHPPHRPQTEELLRSSGELLASLAG
jgi:sugar phosphate isomerase/epimerase